MSKKLLKKDEVVVVKFSESEIIELLKEYLFEHCCEIANIKNKLENVLSHVLFYKEPDGRGGMYLLVMCDSNCEGMGKLDFTEVELNKLKIEDNTPVHYKYEKLRALI